MYWLRNIAYLFFYPPNRGGGGCMAQIVPPLARPVQSAYKPGYEFLKKKFSKDAFIVIQIPFLAYYIRIPSSYYT